MLQKTNISIADPAAVDIAMMQRCIELSAAATRQGEFPFASLICEYDRVVAQATNRVAQTKDVSQHAELLAISKAQQVLGRNDLSSCTIYSNVEPCVMCSFPIRETRIGRVVFAMPSPMMGGLSKWNVLRDIEICNVMPEAFGPVPETIAGLLQHDAEKVWRKWNPVIWHVIKRRGCFDSDQEHCERKSAIPPQLGAIRWLMMRYRNRHSM
jgi:tRNA(adenine34) deaminase